MTQIPLTEEWKSWVQYLLGRLCPKGNYGFGNDVVRKVKLVARPNSNEYMTVPYQEFYDHQNSLHPKQVG